MNSEIDKALIEQYEAVFGPEKMRVLWGEFLESCREKLADIENKTTEEIRLAYHSMRSSCLVFGMVNFAKLCEKLEELALNGAKPAKMKKDIDISKKVFDNETKIVADFLNRLKDER